MNDKNVSVKNIQEGIDYLQDIDRLIQDQQNRLDKFKNDLNAICERAKNQMGESSDIVSHEQAEIDNTLSEV